MFTKDLLAGLTVLLMLASPCFMAFALIISEKRIKRLRQRLKQSKFLFKKEIVLLKVDIKRRDKSILETNSLLREIAFENLKKLRDLVADILRNDKNLPFEFRMTAYLEQDSPECKTACCLLGLANINEIGIHYTSPYYRAMTNMNEYTDRAFCKLTYDEWSFLFGVNWIYYEPTLQDALARLEYFIQAGTCPYPRNIFEVWRNRDKPEKEA